MYEAEYERLGIYLGKLGLVCDSAFFTTHVGTVMQQLPEESNHAGVYCT